MKKLIAAFAVLSLVAAAGCSSQQTASDATITATAVAATPAKVGTVTSTMTFDGNLKAKSEVIVTVSQPGKVISSNVGVGSVVKEGQLLFSMDSKDAAVQKGASKAQYNAAKASADYTNTMISDTNKQITNAKNSKAALEKQMAALTQPISKALEGNPAKSAIEKELKAGNYKPALAKIKALGITNPLFDNLETMVTSADQLSSAITQLESSLKTLKGQKIQADGQVNIAKEGIKAIDAQIKNYKVYAPISGIIGTYDITVGSYPVSQIPLTIVNMDSVLLTVNMLDTQVGKVKTGDNIDITIEALDNRKVSGKVTSVAPSPDMQTRMYPVTVEIENPDHEIKPGFFVKASFPVTQKDNTVYIPSSGILKNDDGTSYIYINSGGVARKTNVETGIEDASGNIEVLSGVNAGDMVITSNLSSLRDGAPVFSLEEKGETN